MDRIREFFGTGAKRGPIFLDEERDDGGDDGVIAGTSSSHAGGVHSTQHGVQTSSSNAATSTPTSPIPPSSSQRNSVLVRHGRGLLSEDGDDDDDGPAAGRHVRINKNNRSNGGLRSKRSSVQTARNDNLEDDELASDNDDDAESDDSLLLGWTNKHSSRRGSSASRKRKGWRRYVPSLKTGICYFLLFLIALAFVAFAIVHIWIGRFVSDQMGDGGILLKERASDALVWRGPDSIKILSMDSDATTVKIDMRMGIDVRTVFGWNTTSFMNNDDDVHAQSQDVRRPSWSRRMERKLIGWATRKTGQASVDLPSPILLIDPSNATNAMAATGLQAPITLPLYFPKSDDYDAEDLSWLRSISLTVPFEVLDPNTMATFINQTMNSRNGNIRVKIEEANLSLGREDDRGWLSRIVKKYGGQKLEDFEVEQSFEVPESPDMPDPEEMVQLKSYSLVAIPNNSSEHHPHKPRHNETTLPGANETLAIYASATIKNPGYEQLHKYHLDLDIPFSWPYKIFLSSPHSHKKNKSHSGELEGRGDAEKEGDEELVLFARGVVEPFSIPSTSEYFDVSINGTVEHTGSSNTTLSQALSAFISRYLSGKNNTVHLSFDSSSPFAKRIPSFLPPLLEPLVVTNIIPGLPPDQRDLLKDLKIDKMRIHGAENGGSGWECDGEMQGELAMPEALDNLQGGINVTSIWPDIMLYDGLPPVTANPEDDKNMPPHPLPANAFARFRTKDWQEAETYINERNQTIMRSMVRNVPLDIVRSDVLQKWIAKIIFSGGRGALTGIKGITEARSTVRGFGQVELHKLSVLGTFYANKPSLMSLSALGLTEE